MDKKLMEIINKIDNSEEIKRFKILEKKIKTNNNYNELINNFNLNKERYEKEKIIRNEIINLRKELYKIDNVKEYALIENEIRIFSKKISKIISSVVENTKC